MAPRKVFEESREWIKQQMQLGTRIRDIFDDLMASGATGSFSAFKKRLNEWNCRKRLPSIFGAEGIETVLRDLFYGCLCSDREIVRILRLDYPSYTLSQMSLRRHRKQLGLSRRTRQADREAHVQNITALLEGELKQGHLEDHGRHLLHTYMRRKYGHQITIGA